MKYQIRKVEEITFWQATEVAELDPEAFRNLEDNPYTGNSQEEFIKYIEEFINSCRWDGFPIELDPETTDELDKMVENVVWTEYNSTVQNGENSWLQLGEKDESYVKTGGFKIILDTASN